jgi:tRNA 2-thiouridine synthesizing protein E
MVDLTPLPPRDADGFLIDWQAWSEGCAQQLAHEEAIALTAAHYEVLYMLRAYFARHEHAPAMRALVSLARRELGSEKGRSLYLLQLFPGSPAKLAAKLAGLPRPEHCL